MKFKTADFQTDNPYVPTFKVRFFRDKARKWGHKLCFEDHDKGMHWFELDNGKKTIPDKNHGGVLGDVKVLIKSCVRTGEWEEVDYKDRPIPGFSRHIPWQKQAKYKKRRVDPKPWKSNLVAADHKGQQAR